MALVLKVKWVEQSNQSEPHQRIRHIGGDVKQLLWRQTQAEAVAAIERGELTFYVERNARPVKLDFHDQSCIHP